MNFQIFEEGLDIPTFNPYHLRRRPDDTGHSPGRVHYEQTIRVFNQYQIGAV